MSILSFKGVFHVIIEHIIWKHWVVIGIFSLLIVFLLIRKSYSVYGSITFASTVFISLVLLDALVIIRFQNVYPYDASFDLNAEWRRFFNGNAGDHVQYWLNLVAFIPPSFFLSEFLSSTKRLGYGRQILFVALYVFGLSLSIETLQLFLRLGLFEITDLVLNSLGGVIGGGLALLMRRMFRINRNQQIQNDYCRDYAELK